MTGTGLLAALGCMRLDAAPTTFRARARMPDSSGAPDGTSCHLFEARSAVRATGLRRTSSRFALLRVFDLALRPSCNPVARTPAGSGARGFAPHQVSDAGASSPAAALPGLVPVFASLAGSAFAARCHLAAPPCLALESARGCGLDALAPASPAPTRCANVSHELAAPASIARSYRPAN